MADDSRCFLIFSTDNHVAVGTRTEPQFWMRIDVFREGKSLVAPDLRWMLIIPGDQKREQIAAIFSQFKLLKIRAQIKSTVVLIPRQAVKALGDIRHRIRHQDRVGVERASIQAEA